VLFPYKDDNPRILYPFVTYFIIGINIFVFLLQFYIEGNNSIMSNNLILQFGFIPYEFNLVKIFTSMFMHGGFLHIIGNMWFLYIFGDNVESILGHIRYFFFYLFCGLFAAVLQFFFDPSSTIPMIGASGAISGILGAYLIKFPKARIHVLAVFFIFITTIVVPAQLVLGIWFLIQLSQGISSIGINTSGGVAWFAHIGGFIGGIGSLKLFQTFKIKNI
tara:strand:- start:150 stop:806 length:657 start_codon:yes stop_codon:yes gene_type:complete